MYSNLKNRKKEKEFRELRDKIQSEDVFESQFDEVELQNNKLEEICQVIN